MAVTTPLGVKRICPSCTMRFYDLNKKPATCPKCGHSYDPTVQPRARRARRTASDALENQDLLIQHMAKNKSKPKKDKEDELEEFEAIEPAGDADIEELEEMEDIDDLEELEDIEESEDESEEMPLEEDDSLIDGVDDVAEGEEEEESDPKRKKPAPKKRKK